MRFISHCKMLYIIAAMVLSVAAIAEKLTTEPILRIDTGMHDSGITNMATDARGRYMVTLSAQEARVWEISTNNLLNTLRFPLNPKHTQMKAVAISPDGTLIVIGGYSVQGDDKTFFIYIFDSSSSQIIKVLKGLKDAPRLFAWSPDGSLFATDAKHIYRTDNWELIGKFGTNETVITGMDFDRDNNLIVAVEKSLKLYQIDNNGIKIIRQQLIEENGGTGAVSFSPDGSKVALIYDVINAASFASKVLVFDAHNLQRLYETDIQRIKGGRFNSVSWSSDSKTIYGGGSIVDGQAVIIRAWNKKGRGVHQDTHLPLLRREITKVKSLPNGGIVFTTAAPSWGVIDKQGNITQQKWGENVNFFSSKPMLSHAGSAVRFAYEAGGKSPAVFSLSSGLKFGEETQTMFHSPRLEAPGINITTDRSSLYLDGKRLDGGAGSFIGYALFPDGNKIAIANYWGMTVFNIDGKSIWSKYIHSVVSSVNISGDGRYVVAGLDDGTIRWYRASDGAEQLAFFPHADKKRWVMWTPSGYYDASPGAEDLIGWHVNNGKDHEADFFPASRFRERFFRPDVISKVLETQDEAEAVRLANEASGRRSQTVSSIAQVLPPVVEIVSPAGDSTVQPGKLTVRYRVRTAVDAPVTAMRVRVNGLLQSDTRALKRVAENNDDVKEIEVTIPEAGIQSATRALKRVGQGKASSGDTAPSSQEVEVQLFAENKFSTSTPAILRLQLAGGKGSTKQTASGKPKLYVLAVGVSKYANPEYNLGLASKDANDFVNSLKGQKGKLYSDVLVKLLTDAQATRDDVLDGLDWLKQNVTANDVGVMFVAGHGMNDKLGGYYFMPHNADPEKLARTGVSQTDIKQTFANLPGHTVFFIDTCYSGGVMGNVRTSGFVNDLASAENGAVVFTASSAGQESLENPSWGNGAFTKSVVEGLNGKADAFNSGAVTVKGLDFYVDSRVKSLTKGQQTPVSIAPGGLSDFPLAGVGK